VLVVCDSVYVSVCSYSCCDVGQCWRLLSSHHKVSSSSACRNLDSWLKMYQFSVNVVLSASCFISVCCSEKLITFCVSRRWRKMYCGHVRLYVCLCVCMSVCAYVCLSAAVRPHYCTDPDVTWGRVRGCPVVVQYWADLQSVHGLRCYGNNAKPSLLGVCARCWLLTGGWRGILKISRRISQVGVAGWPSTGGVLNITAAAWTAGFWRSGNITRT